MSAGNKFYQLAGPGWHNSILLTLQVRDPGSMPGPGNQRRLQQKPNLKNKKLIQMTQDQFIIKTQNAQISPENVANHLTNGLL